MATVNDVHFGETVCGLIEGQPEIGPVLTVEPGEPPYPETMNRAAVAEIQQLEPDALVVKGDLTGNGTPAEYDDFLACYGTAFGDRLHHIWGNHDGYHGHRFADQSPQEVILPGVTLAIIDTTIPRKATGGISDEQLEWLDELGARADRPVLVFGHHHAWDPGSRKREPTYYGIHPDSSEKLVGIFARQPRLVGYFAGHTHRNRVRRFAATGERPWAELSAVKDYPGAWAEYRVFEGGILQVFHRVAAPAALRWTERTREMFNGLYASYSFGRLEDRCFVVHRA